VRATCVEPGDFAYGVMKTGGPGIDAACLKTGVATAWRLGQQCPSTGRGCAIYANLRNISAQLYAKRAVQKKIGDS
jgi:hypothetical protein